MPSCKIEIEAMASATATTRMQAMQMPNVATTGKDSANNITYHVMAYRSLSPQELQFCVRQYRAQTKKKPKRGSVVTIHTVIGATG